MLFATAVSYSAGRAMLVQDASVGLRRGEVLAMLGPNGAGKSTLLRLLAGELRADAGRIDINGRQIQRWSAAELARQRAVLPQSESLRFAFESSEVVRLGRYPWGERDNVHAERIVDAALLATGAQHLSRRRYTELSAGERARVQLARVLAQVWEPDAGHGRALLLDEPTANLDLAHQHQLLATLRTFARAGASVLLVLHDLNLALEYADRVALMRRGCIVAQGPVQDTLTADRIAEVFGVEVELLRRADGRTWIAANRPLAPAGAAR